MKKIGLLLIIVGLIMTLITGFNLATNKKLIDAGPVEINKKESHRIAWPPIVGISILLGGVFIFAMNNRASRKSY